MSSQSFNMNICLFHILSTPYINKLLRQQHCRYGLSLETKRGNHAESKNCQKTCRIQCTGYYKGSLHFLISSSNGNRNNHYQETYFMAIGAQNKVSSFNLFQDLVPSHSNCTIHTQDNICDMHNSLLSGWGQEVQPRIKHEQSNT